MKSFGIVGSPPPAALIFLLSEIESAAPCAPLRLELVVNLVSELGAAQENEGGTIFTRKWFVIAPHVSFYVNTWDSITSGHAISHFNAPFLPSLKIEGEFKHVSSRRSRGGAARPGHTSLSSRLHLSLDARFPVLRRLTGTDLSS